MIESAASITILYMRCIKVSSKIKRGCNFFCFVLTRVRKYLN